jgi:hypothetical protein
VYHAFDKKYGTTEFVAEFRTLDFRFGPLITIEFISKADNA